MEIELVQASDSHGNIYYMVYVDGKMLDNEADRGIGINNVLSEMAPKIKFIDQ